VFSDDYDDSGVTLSSAKQKGPTPPLNDVLRTLA